MSPSIDWDTIDAAVESLDAQGLHHVSATSHGPHTAEIKWKFPTTAMWMTDEAAFESRAEVNTANMVIGYTLRLPGIIDMPDAPAPDVVSVALTSEAEPLPPGREVDIVRVRNHSYVNNEMAPHIRGEDTEYINIQDFVAMMPEIQNTYYERVGGEQ
jgi:hypothetical protein